MESTVIKNEEFLKSISQYFMDFLDTDFKKSRIPKRNTITKIKNKVSIGIDFEKYPKLKNKLFASLYNGFSKETLSVKKGEYVKNIPPHLISLLEKKINNLTEKDLKFVYESFRKDLPILMRDNKQNYDIFVEKSLLVAEKTIKKHLILPFLTDLDAPLENMGLAGVKSKYQLEIDITGLILSICENKLKEELKFFFIEQQKQESKNIEIVFPEFLNLKKIIDMLFSFFKNVSINDAFLDIYKIHSNIRLLDKVESYLYFYDISTSKGSFPVFYIPVSISKDEKDTTFSIQFDKRLFINTKAIDFAVQEFNQENETSASLKNAFDRILYLSDIENAENKINSILEILYNFFGFNKSLTRDNQDIQVIENISTSLSNKCSLYLFDKADEALINDYEEILNDTDSNITKTFSELINGFIMDNPKPYMKEVTDEWDENSIKNKLVRQSPIPLNDEQKQILIALNKDKCKFITIEGPPGTGKSHTITAIICQALMYKKSVLVLSDKPEALDVVEDKISSTLNKVRQDESFQNPILRLGKTGNKFYKIVQSQSLEKIKEHFLSYKKLKETLDVNRAEKIEYLKNQIDENIEYYKNINIEEVKSYFENEKKFNNIEWIDSLDNLEYLNESFIKIKNLIEHLKNYKGYDFPISFAKQENIEIINQSKDFYFNVLNLKNNIHNFFNILPTLSDYNSLLVKISQRLNIVNEINAIFIDLKSGNLKNLKDCIIANQTLEKYKIKLIEILSEIKLLIENKNKLREELNLNLKSIKQDTDYLLKNNIVLDYCSANNNPAKALLLNINSDLENIKETLTIHLNNFNIFSDKKLIESQNTLKSIDLFLEFNQKNEAFIQEINIDDSCFIVSNISQELNFSEYQKELDFIQNINNLRKKSFQYFNKLHNNTEFLTNFKFEDISVENAINALGNYLLEIKKIRNPVFGYLFKKKKIDNLNKKLKRSFPYLNTENFIKNRELTEEVNEFFIFIFTKFKDKKNKEQIFIKLLHSLIEINSENSLYINKEELLENFLLTILEYKEKIQTEEIKKINIESFKPTLDESDITKKIIKNITHFDSLKISFLLENINQSFENISEVEILISKINSLQKELELLNFVENFSKENPKIKKLIDLDIENRILSNITCALNNYNLDFINEYFSFNSQEKLLIEKFSNTPNDAYNEEITTIEDLVTADMTYFLDKRIIEYTDEYAGEVQNLKTIISQKQKFPKALFQNLKKAFPCILSGIRDYAEFIPLEKDLFDIIIIDEASQVSIAQALPALIRGKQIIVLGDEKQFSNVKSGNASKLLNQEYKNNIKKSFIENVLKNKEDSFGWLSKVTENFDIKNSILTFGKFIRNYDTLLKKHFRCYPEIISYSDKYFYNNTLQCMKIRGKPLNEVIKFTVLEDQEKIEIYNNTNSFEIDYIIEKLKKFKEDNIIQTIGIITPHTDQVQLIINRIDEIPEKSWLYGRCKLKIMTFDACQGEERDYIFYSMVANKEKDALRYIFPVRFDEEKNNVKAQRLNVGFSRAKECIHFVLSKEPEEFSGEIRNALIHYKGELENISKKQIGNTDPNSPMEKKIQQYFYSTEFYKNNKKSIEFIPQFDIGKYLKQLDRNYHHPHYKVDFLLQFNNKKIVIEYDGFKEHFENLEEVNNTNYSSYMKEEDIYRQKVLEGYGYKFLRINKFNLGKNPIEILNNRLENLLKKKSKNLY